MSSTYIKLPPSAGGGGGAVDSVNGLTGTVVLTKANIGLSNVNNTSDANKPISTATQTALDGKQNIIAESFNQLLYYSPSAEVDGVPGLFVDPNFGGLTQTLVLQPDNNTGASINGVQINVEPLQNSPDENYQIHRVNVNLDNASSGFTFGTSGNAVKFLDMAAANLGTGNTGEVNFIQNYANIGNGTDPISLKGLSYAYGFANINANVTVNGAIQGYGFQPTVDAAATMGSGTSYVTAFYDFANFGTEVFGYSSFSAGPTIAEVGNNSGYAALNVNPNITNFNGNSGANAIAVSGSWGTFGTGSFQGVSINPTITSVANATGIYVNMSNVTSGNKKALDVVGDVSINGALAFTGALSIGQLQAFYQTNPVDGGGNPLNMHGLTTGLTALNGITTANADAIGVNNAMLITLEDNSTTTSGPFKLGFAAVALPCVVETRTGSSLDYMNMATYALNLAGTSTGGTIGRVNGVRVEAIPNGITTINEFVAFEFDQTFGQVGTDVWGLHIVPTYVENFIGGSLAIGTSSQKVSNSNVGLELGAADKVFLNARLNSTEIAALTPINGMQVYNTTTDKLQVYAAGSWADLH